MPHNSPVNYTDGVPVKISEKYKQPPEIKLTTKLTQQLSRRKDPVEAFPDYNFDLERKIISKTTEWINWRLKEKTERQQRIQQRELIRQKRLEEEQKAKLNQVSYPSDELTSSCDEDDDEEKDVSNEARIKSSNSNNSQACIPSDKVFNPNFNTILMPTQAVVQSTDKKSHRRYASNSSNKIDFSFFESDSSPFDNLEMKSMNDMDILAKVLQSTVVEGNTECDDNTLERNNSSESDPSDQQKSINNNNENDTGSSSDTTKVLIEKNDTQLMASTQTNAYSAHNNFSPQQLYNNYYGMQPSTINANQPFYINHQQQQQHQFGTATNQYSPYIVNHQIPNSCYYTQNYAVNHMSYALNNNIMACENTISDEIKSKSVPDIVKELNDELNNSERRRTRNISQSTNSNVPVEDDTIVKRKSEDDLSNLPAKTQSLAKQICQMGFKQDLVIRALIRLGDNDKHAVEHLISLNEILQMGFDEEKVSEALIKFDNNKDQALDYLIS